jgi:hypothetical protein
LKITYIKQCSAISDLQQISVALIMACLQRMLRLLGITVLTFMLLLSLSAPPFSLSPSSTSSATVASAAATENEPGHVIDKSMNVDHESIREDFEKIKVAREFYLQRTGALRRPHNCSAFVPEYFRGVLAPQLNDSTYNATAAGIAREILGSTMCVFFLVTLGLQPQPKRVRSIEPYARRHANDLLN